MATQSLGELGRFAEAGAHAAELLRRTEPTQHAHEFRRRGVAALALAMIRELGMGIGRDAADPDWGDVRAYLVYGLI